MWSFAGAGILFLALAADGPSDTPGDAPLEPVPIGDAANLSADDAGQVPGAAELLANGLQMHSAIPFEVAITGFCLALLPGGRPESELAIPISGRACELYLLVVANLVGDEEPVYDLTYHTGSKPFESIHNIDRLRVSVAYADGGVDEYLPARVDPPGWGVIPGAQVLTVLVDPTRELSALRVYLGTPQASLAVAGATANRSESPRYADRWVVRDVPTSAEKRVPLPDIAPHTVLGESTLTLSNRELEATVHLHTGTLSRLYSRASDTEWQALSPLPLFGAVVDGVEMPATAWRYVGAEAHTRAAGCELTYACEEAGLRSVVNLSIGEGVEIGCSITIAKCTGESVVEPIGPRVGPMRPRAEGDLWYLYPHAQTILSDAQGEYSQWYGGSLMPLQFMDAFSPEAGSGVSLHVKDLDSLEKRYDLAVQDGRATMAIVYQPRAMKAWEAYNLAPSSIAIHPGDWRAGYRIYRDWVATWYHDEAPRPPWWREAFNLRQVFLHLDHFGTALDPATGRYELLEYVRESEEVFGGVDYLHIFDWGFAGNARTYGRLGGPYPQEPGEGYRLPGGWPPLLQAVSEVRDHGVPVGYYLEGYLLNETTPLGHSRGEEWVAWESDGEWQRWPNSPELGMCQAQQSWQDVQVEAFSRMAQVTGADGLYNDQYSMNGPGRWCYRPDHGHRAPSNALRAEEELTQRLRRRLNAVRPDCVLYTEYTPTDVISQFQDGAFSYSMQRQQGSVSVAPLKLFRFAFPAFKNFEILRCDQPTGTFAEGVRWTFWNGEGIWLQGPARDWFAPQTQREITRCHAVLREHREAFASQDVETLVPTLAHGVFANRFTSADTTVYTLYNAHNRTVSGEALRVPHYPGSICTDAFTGTAVPTRVEAESAVLSVSIPPHGVACVVLRRQ